MSELLVGCHAKIQRAEENIRHLNREINGYVASSSTSYRMIREFRNDGRQYAFVAFGNSSVPPRFAVLAGEIVHQLRSSLDHLLCALVKKRGGRPSRKHQFPIYTSVREFDNARARGIIDGVSASAEALIRSVQPYTSPTPDDTVLHVVQQFDNLDKHQLLLVTSTVMAIGDKIRVNPKVSGLAITGMTPPYPRKITRDGVVVFGIDLAQPATDTDFDADADFVTHVAFEKCGRAELVEIISTLTGLLQGTAHTVKLFESEF
ncbi:hypothetical protein [Bradyrhizobium sp.]|uniref:hypothetical protein n=1 Tax=Bradyrhizobium sp. TaxID=376 RepID=UPI001D848B02|nr:hypothetical protein [Bradyrhizobium sp.]MBI5318915.1 hypothetical protein [Bradyrhizobium sp.]